jgi:KDO2-lipid IV(A) lauroyltransferase
MSALKSIAQSIGWQMMAHLWRVARAGPRSSVHRQTALVGGLASRLMSSRRGVIQANLSKAFPAWSWKRTNDMACTIVRCLSHTIADILYYPMHPDALRRDTIVRDQGVLDDALALGRGVIVATGHIGVFPFVAAPVTWAGRSLGVVAKDPRDPRFGRLLVDQSNRVGMDFIGASSRAGAARSALRILKDGGAVVFLFDMYPGDGNGLSVEFMGRTTEMYNGMVRLAAKTGAPLMPGSMVRSRTGANLEVRYATPLEVPRAASDDASVEAHAAMSALASWLTAEIRARPEQWWWIHRRWR